MLHRVEHVRQSEIWQEFSFGAELGTSLHEKCAKRLHRTTLIVFSAFDIAAHFRFAPSVFALDYGVVHVKVERQLSVLIDLFHLVRQIVPYLQTFRGYTTERTAVSHKISTIIQTVIVSIPILTEPESPELCIFILILYAVSLGDPQVMGGGGWGAVHLMKL